MRGQEGPHGLRSHRSDPHLQGRTNEFLAPAGGDGFSAFEYMQDLTYWGDMLDLVNAYASAHYTRGPSVGYTQLAALVRQERAHNPKRTLLASSA
jgi:2',3'-cyclic-nucleotide 2'-phosphodiesterase (5'-nucleotidase family)